MDTAIIPRELLGLRELNGNDKIVMLVLMDLILNRGDKYISVHIPYARLSDKCGISVNTARGCIKNLVEFEFIERMESDERNVLRISLCDVPFWITRRYGPDKAKRLNQIVAKIIKTVKERHF